MLLSLSLFFFLALSLSLSLSFFFLSLFLSSLTSVCSPSLCLRIVFWWRFCSGWLSTWRSCLFIVSLSCLVLPLYLVLSNLALRSVFRLLLFSSLLLSEEKGRREAKNALRDFLMCRSPPPPPLPPPPPSSPFASLASCLFVSCCLSFFFLSFNLLSLYLSLSLFLTLSLSLFLSLSLYLFLLSLSFPL